MARRSSDAGFAFLRLDLLRAGLEFDFSFDISNTTCNFFLI